MFLLHVQKEKKKKGSKWQLSLLVMFQWFLFKRKKKVFHWFSWETFLAYSSTGPCKPTNTQELKRCSKVKTWDILAPKEGTKNSFHPNSFPILRLTQKPYFILSYLSRGWKGIRGFEKRQMTGNVHGSWNCGLIVSSPERKWIRALFITCIFEELRK